MPHNEQPFLCQKHMVWPGEGIKGIGLFRGQHIDVVFLPHSQSSQCLTHPGRRHGDFINGVIRRELHIIENALTGIAHSCPVGDLLFRIDDLVRAVAQQEFPVDITGRPGEDQGCAIVLEQSRDLQGTLDRKSVV